MALEAFSTQASVEARASVARVKLWTDKDRDGTPDPVTLTQGFQFASGMIFGYLQKRYGETELASWTIASCPDQILRISDDLCMWYFSSGNQGQNPLISEIFERAVIDLEAIRLGDRALYGASEAAENYTSETEDPTNLFTSRTYWGHPTGTDIASTGATSVTRTTTLEQYLVSPFMELVAGDTIGNEYDADLIKGESAAIELISTPTIANGRYDGQRKTIYGLDDTNLVTLQDEKQLTSSGLRLAGGKNMVLGKNDSLSVQWLRYQSKWVEFSRVDSY